MNLQHQDVVMKLFFDSLVGDAKAQYNSLPNKSIKTWEDFEISFLRKWGDEKDEAFLFSEFDNIEKHEQEPIREFNARFDALVEEFTCNIRPSRRTYPSPVSKCFRRTIPLLVEGQISQNLF
jgi:hypothetical protein